MGVQEIATDQGLQEKKGLRSVIVLRDILRRVAPDEREPGARLEQNRAHEQVFERRVLSGRLAQGQLHERPVEDRLPQEAEKLVAAGRLHLLSWGSSTG